MIRNPILPGFNADPSICRVGSDYYIATSTFEWYPGVQIHHSTDLVNWRLVKRPLDRASQLDMRGNPDSGGIWAPCLSHADGLFWLVYTDVKRMDGNFKDTHNYIVTAKSIEGPWSDPVYVNSSGFDPSLFHDDDGRKWFLNMLWNHISHGVGGSPKHPSFAGILLQEYDAAAGRLVGPVKNIFAGSPHGLVEGPHIFKRDGWYYLTTAEGGTGYDHAVTMARSRSIEGPYELHPDTHLITSKDAPDAVLQRAGHGQIVETPEGAFYHTHLCSRPLPGLRRSPLGRETAIQRCVWGEDGWLRLEHGGPVPAVDVPAPTADAEPEAARPMRYAFDTPDLPLDFQWLRTPFPERLFSLAERPGHLRLHGRESIGSWFEQALVARRQEHHAFRAETLVDFAPETFQQAAGLTLYYNRHKFHFLGVTHDARRGRVLTILSCPGVWPEGKLEFPLAEPIVLRDAGPVELAADVRGAALQFSWKGEGGWRPVGPVLDAGVISDEGGRGEHASFTGAFVGMIAFDVSGRALPADFAHFTYAPGEA
ncbi:glycoside hydrolase family 43 protein [Arvimicrobium flavum]|uniref:glycoside hydrolase family 43 protein n=1 Tax=Arvimicrobium flavum TaxID=3393320 RepID=UPI00237A0D2F|nr:glycoside hydrolase family 43 protein [Mesorhizobium shangrilense]